MREILEETQASSYKVYLTGINNFRKEIYPEYKANRIGAPKPKHLAATVEFLINEWKAETTDGYEADDALGMEQTEDTVICSIDKDLLMIPGHHWNFVKKETTIINELEGIRQLYRQSLIGDTSDNIFGVKGVGKVGASKLIDHLEDEKEMYEMVKEKYQNDQRLLVNLNCLWIWRNMNEKWSDRFESSHSL
jgi:DNA polymerase-1